MAKQKFNELAINILELIGGKENIVYFVHCVTRLRFNLKDKGLVNIEEIEKLQGVLGTQWQGDQFQIILGQNVAEAYKLICDKGGLEAVKAVEENLDRPKMDLSIKNLLSMLMNTLSSILAPFIPAIVGCGLLQGLLYSAQIFGWVDASSQTYEFLFACANTAFYFLPILVAFSSAKRFGCNPYIAAVLGAILIHPTFIGLEGQSIDLFGFIHITFFNYSSSVVPAILTIYFMSWVEKALKKVIPNMIEIIITPFLTIMISAIFGFFILAPIGNYIGHFITGGLMYIYTLSGPLGGLLYSATYPFMLMTGMQVAVIPIMLNNFATLGYDVLYPCEAASNAAMAACAIYIYFKARKQNTKSMALSTGITGLIGVTEPVLFGIVMKYKKVLYASVIGGGAGGAIMGLFTVQYSSFGFVPFGTIILAIGPTFTYYLIGVFVAMAVAVIALHFLKFEEA